METSKGDPKTDNVGSGAFLTVDQGGGQQDDQQDDSKPAASESAVLEDTENTETNGDDPEEAPVQSNENNVGDNDGNADDDDKERTLDEDSFSFLLTTAWKLDNFLILFFSMGIWVSQVAIYCLVLVNFISKSSGGQLDLPPNVDASTRVAQVRIFSQKYNVSSEKNTKPQMLTNTFSLQFIAIVIMTVSQEDARIALLLIRDSKWSNQQTPFRQQFKEATVVTKLVSIICRLIAGLLGILATFFLIMQSEDVVELLLGFTAIEFVSQLDNLGFKLAQLGFMGGVLSKKAKETMKPFGVLSGSSNVCLNRWLPRILIAIVFTVLITGWSVIFWLQQDGHYTHGKHVYVTFVFDSG